MQKQLRHFRAGPASSRPAAQAGGESGQALVLLVFAMIGLMMFAALALDGGHLYLEQRSAQAAVDFAALAAARARCTGGDYEAQAYAIAAANGYNNDGVTHNLDIFNPPTSGSYENPDDGFEIVLTTTVPSAFAHLIYGGPLAATVRAIGYCDAASGGGDNTQWALFALGPCSDIKAIEFSGSRNEVVGGAHSNDDLYLAGSNNHMHGTVTTDEGTTLSGSNNIFDAGSPTNGQPDVANPYASWTTSMFGPGGDMVDGLIVHDLSSGGKVDKGRLVSLGLYDDGTNLLDTGVYYAGNQEIDLGDSEMHGTVTFVSEQQIATSGSRLDFTAYAQDVVMFSNYTPSVGNDPCKVDAIDLSGSDGTDYPDVTHDPEPAGNAIALTESNNVFRGLIYAPRATVKGGGSKTTIRGAIVSQGIILGGSDIVVWYDGTFLPPASPYSIILMR